MLEVNTSASQIPCTYHFCNRTDLSTNSITAPGIPSLSSSNSHPGNHLWTRNPMCRPGSMGFSGACVFRREALFTNSLRSLYTAPYFPAPAYRSAMRGKSWASQSGPEEGNRPGSVLSVHLITGFSYSRSGSSGRWRWPGLLFFSPGRYYPLCIFRRNHFA